MDHDTGRRPRWVWNDLSVMGIDNWLLEWTRPVLETQSGKTSGVPGGRGPSWNTDDEVG